MYLKEKISLNSKVVDLNESVSNDIYMKLTMCVLTNNTNLNGAKFTSGFIEEIVSNKSHYLGIPLVANKQYLEDKEFDNLTHELDLDDGTLNTDVIGSFTDFYSEEDEDGSLKLMADVKVYKRFKNVCSSVIELFNSGSLSFSCECLIYDYASIEDDGTRVIDADGGKLFASAVVSEAAETKSKASVLVAEAYQKDMEQDRGYGTPISRVDYNKGVNIRYHDKEIASLNFFDIEVDIMNKLNPINFNNGHRKYNYLIYELYHDKVVVLDENDCITMYSISYRVENDTVILEKKENWIKGDYQFVPEGVMISDLMDKNTKGIKELEEKVNNLKEEKDIMAQDNKDKLEKLEEEIEKLKEEIGKLEEEKKELSEKGEGLESTIVSQKEEAVKAEKQIGELNELVESLKPFKDQVEKAEKDSKVAELNAKFSKLLSEEIMGTEEVVNAINELDEAKLNSMVVAEVAKAKSQEAEYNSVNDDVTITASKQGDLIEPTLLQKYGLD